MRISKLSNKQKQVLTFVADKRNYLIADGSVRSGKTVVMSMSFIIWAMENFNKTNFAICGKTVAAAERNVVHPLMNNESLPYRFDYKAAKHVLMVGCDDVVNYFYIFGGNDERSASLIQGMTLAGALLDEVALMARSFVEQTMTRVLTYPNFKIFFNCNPDSPRHWFYEEWICKCEEKQAKHIHFLMNDNPIVTQAEIDKAETMFSGVFYSRYIKGEWVMADGLVYTVFDESSHLLNFSNKIKKLSKAEYDNFVNTAEYYVSIDYGITNPFCALLWCVWKNKAYCVSEYYYNIHEKNKPQLTDEEHYTNIDNWLIKQGVDNKIEQIIIDPSATSFKQVISRHDKYSYCNADNSVIPGIAYTTGLFQRGLIFIDESCENLVEEMGLYRWDMDAATDSVIKESDHACDAMRYFTMTKFKKLYDNVEYDDEPNQGAKWYNV